MKTKMPPLTTNILICALLIGSRIPRFCFALKSDNQNSNDVKLFEHEFKAPDFETVDNYKTSVLLDSLRPNHFLNKSDLILSEYHEIRTVNDNKTNTSSNLDISSHRLTEKINNVQDDIEITKGVLPNNSTLPENSTNDVFAKLFGNGSFGFRNPLRNFYSMKDLKPNENGQVITIENASKESKLNSLEQNDMVNSLNSFEKFENDSSVNNSGLIRREGARQFQFLLHPYLPYGKDLMPDEKISIHDVLPVKMAKFIKSMVEDAPWEAMFMKMVRMVVDQFVDKIIEKMFAHKDDEDDKWRSADGPLIPASSIFPIHTSVERLRRSAEIVLKKPKESWKKIENLSDEDLFKNDMYKELNESDNRPWIDIFLDYVFPDDNETNSNSGEKYEYEIRKRRDTNHFKSLADFNHKLSNSEFLDEINASSNFRRLLKDFIKYRLLKRILQPFVSGKDPTDAGRSPTHLMNSYRLKMAEENVGTFTHAKVDTKDNLVRRKRDSGNTNHKDKVQNKKLWQSYQKAKIPNFNKGVNSKRLWQSDHEMRSSNFKRDDCSLRRACNAGRLLSRLPSVENITLQLKSFHHEPHWDALLWGMKKKRCSRIFCNRQRSPKGSKNAWNLRDKRHSRKKLSAPHNPRDSSSDFDMTTIMSI